MLAWTKPQFKDDIEDGYDASLPYQMVPKLGKRFMMLRTGTLRVEMTVARGLSCGLANFHVTRPFGKVVSGLPSAGQTVQKVTIPADTEVQFDITAGAAPGHGFLDVHQFHHGNLKSPSPELQLLVSVKDRTARNFLVCDLFDEIHRDFGIRARIEPAFAAAQRVFAEQANIVVLKTDDVDVTIGASSGEKFNFRDKKLMTRVLKATKAKHGQDVFVRNTAVIFLLQVPIEIIGKDGTKHAPMGASPTYRLDGRLHSTILLTAPTAVSDFVLPIVLPHEMGHVMGLEHVPADLEAEFPKNMPLPQRRAKQALPFLHNLMFPAAMTFGSRRLLSFQIEQSHQTRPPIVIIDLDTPQD